MARTKTVIQPMASNAARRATFKKRKASLFKKAQELSTLCDVEVCAIVSEGPNDPNAPEVWPPCEDAVRVLSRFRGMSEADKGKKMVDQVGYLSQQLEKMQMQLRKVQSENCELETALLLNGLLSGLSGIASMASLETMVNLSAMVEMRLGEIGRRMSNLASASVPMPNLTDFDKWVPPAPAQFSKPAFGLTAEVASVQGWSTGSEKGELKERNGCFLGPTGDDVAPMMVGSQAKEVDEMDQLFDYSTYGFDYEVDDEIAALLFS